LLFNYKISKITLSFVINKVFTRFKSQYKETKCAKGIFIFELFLIPLDFETGPDFFKKRKINLNSGKPNGLIFSYLPFGI